MSLSLVLINILYGWWTVACWLFLKNKHSLCLHTIWVWGLPLAFLDHYNRKWCLVWEKIFSFGKIVLKYRLRNCSRDATWVHSFNRCTPNLPPCFRIGAMEAHLHGAKKLGTSKRLWEVLEKVVFMGIVGQGKMFPFQRKGKSCVCESAARTEGKSILLWLIFFTKSMIHFSVEKHVSL